MTAGESESATVDDAGALARRWAGLWRRVAAPGAAGPDFRAVVAAYGEPHRHYHTLAHVAACLSEFDAVRPAFDTPDAAEVALWCHDWVYDPRGHDNEVQSAVVAAKLLAATGTGDLSPVVAQLILATAHTAPPASGDERLVVDIDLAILGQPPAAFDAYERAIRREYAHVPDAAFAAGRAAVLRAFLDRPSIYSTPEFVGRYEQVARDNLVRSLARWGE